MSTDELIEQYFSNRLSEKERLEFDQFYETDKDFRDEVDFLKSLKAISEDVDSKNFKVTLQGFEKEHQSTKTTSINKSWLKPLSALAAVLIIALIINFGLNRSLDEAELFEYYFEPSKNVTQPIVRSDNDKNILDDAFIAYNDADYKAAILLFEKVYQTSKQSELFFYEGNALLALGKPEESIKKFKEHLLFSDVLTNRSHWYLALAYLRTKDLGNAKLQLNALLNSGEKFKKEEATSILKKLE